MHWGTSEPGALSELEQTLLFVFSLSRITGISNCFLCLLPFSSSFKFWGLLVDGRFSFNAYMWRSNVLRVGKCSSSAAAARYGQRVVRRYGSAASLPITAEEFKHALSKVLRGVGKENKTLGMRRWKSIWRTVVDRLV